MLDGIIRDEEKLSGIISPNVTICGKLGVSVRDVPFYETKNEAGGTTVYISKEVVDNGS